VKINKIRDSNPFKSSVLYKTGSKMGNKKVDRDQQYMMEMWGTSHLVTDYGSLRMLNSNGQFLQEIANPEIEHQLRKQTELHKKIRNDNDYDDWEYGTEPSYGRPWK
jgi:hypothetical protein